MTPQTFRLNLFDTTRSARLATLLVLGIFALIGLTVWAGVQLEPTWLKLAVILLILGGGGYAGWRAYRQAAIVPAVVTLTSAGLQIEDTRPTPRLSQTLPLADISTYSYFSYNNTEELRLNRAAAPPLRLRSTGAFSTKDNGEFGRLVAAFEQLMEQAPNPAGVATRREKSFFEKPISTYLLIPFTLLVVLLLVAVFASGRHSSGGLIGGLVSYAAYLRAWRAAAPRRNAAWHRPLL